VLRRILPDVGVMTVRQVLRAVDRFKLSDQLPPDLLSDVASRALATVDVSTKHGDGQHEEFVDYVDHELSIILDVALLLPPDEQLRAALSAALKRVTDPYGGASIRHKADTIYAIAHAAAARRGDAVPWDGARYLLKRFAACPWQPLPYATGVRHSHVADNSVKCGRLT
jgi:hypothetical protein